MAMEEEETKQSLKSPLIPPPLPRRDGGSFTRDEIWAEVKKQLRLAGPLMTVNLLINCLQMISVMFVGHLGQLPLAGASMATSFASVTGFSLLAQNNVLPMAVIAASTALLHYFVCWALVFRSGLGNRGAALANAMSYWINAVALAVYVRVSPSCRKTWTGFSGEAFRGILNFVKLSIPSAIMLSLEIWSFEMVVLLSGLLPNPKLETSVLSISLNTTYMIYMIPLGISGAVSTRVSNELGGRRAKAAILAGRVAMGMVATEGAIAAIIIIIGRTLWGYCYSTDHIVVGYLAQILILLAILHIFDGIQSIFSGITRGCGRQKIGAFINLGAYYFVGIPMAIFLAFFQGIGGKGLWMGIMAAVFLQALFLGILILCTNWDKEVKKAADRVTSSMLENLLE